MAALSVPVPWQIDSFCSRKGKTWAVILPFNCPSHQLSFFTDSSRKTSLHPNPFPPLTFPVLLPSLLLLTLRWQSLVCGARAEILSAPTPACLLMGGAEDLGWCWSAFQFLCVPMCKRGKSVPLISPSGVNLKDVLISKCVIKELDPVGSPRCAHK